MNRLISRVEKSSLNQAAPKARLDIYATIIWQNRIVYAMFFVLIVASSAMIIAMLSRPVPVLLVDEQGRYVAEVSYRESPPLNEQQLETMSKRFLQHYLSQNSATIYEDAALALAALCPALREPTRKEWVDGGRLARIVERVQVSRVVFSEFALLKYLTPTDIQVSAVGKILFSSDRSGEISTDFKLLMSLRLAPITANNYLGIEVCDIKLI